MVLMALFDKDLALSQAGDNPELAQELFEMLINDLPQSQQAMNQAHKDNNKDAFWDATHKIHGGTAYCGVPDLKTACKALEDEIKAGYPGDKVDIALAELNKQIDLLLAEKDEFVSLLMNA